VDAFFAEEEKDGIFYEMNLHTEEKLGPILMNPQMWSKWCCLSM